HKDVWFGGDVLIGNQAAFSVSYYRGQKLQVQNQGAPDELIYEPETRRYGLYGSYRFFRQLDVLLGYQYTKEDWQQQATSPLGSFTGSSLSIEVDEYIRQGLVAWARYDSNPYDAPVPALVKSKDHRYMFGILKTLTERGNVKAYLQYSYETFDTWQEEHSKNRRLTAGLDLAW
ncbi:MAG: hypothetical protein GXP47_11285, partial [Acidobacteria bacterium]|nr:hypothetical protein [Acidobacteriota bacterium]